MVGNKCGEIMSRAPPMVVIVPVTFTEIDAYAHDMDCIAQSPLPTSHLLVKVCLIDGDVVGSVLKRRSQR
jgi:hypothetical protein